MKKVMVASIFFTLFIALSVPYLYSHPHMFIDTRVTFEFDRGGLKGFWIDWTFDRLFTEMIIVDYRLDRNRTFTDTQVAAVKEGAFSNLRHFDYFTYVIHNEKRHAVKEVHSFNAFMRENRLVYTFFVPFEVPVSGNREKIRVMIYDHTFFCDIAYVKDNPVAFSSADFISASYDIRRNRDIDIYYPAEDATVSRQNVEYTGFAHPYELVLEFQRR